MQKPHYEMIEILAKSDLYKCFYKMPKPAVHHTHLTGALDTKDLLYFTEFDFVYFSEKENKFFVSKTPEVLSKNGKSIFEAGESHENYIKANLLRQYWKTGTDFDTWLNEKFKL